jgi:hypothetical protein
VVVIVNVRRKPRDAAPSRCARQCFAHDHDHEYGHDHVHVHAHDGRREPETLSPTPNLGVLCVLGG